MSVTLDIPANVVDAMHLPPPEVAPRLRLELSVSLYAQSILGLGKAAELAGLSRTEMTELLARRRVPMQYGPEELKEDAAHARTFDGRDQ